MRYRAFWIGLLRRVAIALSVVLAIGCQAQRSSGVYCVSGDCQNGFGKREVVLSRTLAVVFEGYFKNGVPSGAGLERTFRIGQIESEFSGFFREGIPYGQGTSKTYDEKGNLSIEATGNYEDGLLEGPGVLRLYYADKLVDVYEGEFRKGLKNGSGTEYTYTVGNTRRMVFVGGFKNGHRHGFGKEFNYFDDEGSVLRSGIWKDGQYQGPR